MKTIKLFLFAIILLAAGNLYGKELYIGISEVDVTPDFPVALNGQFEVRVAYSAETPLKACILALESREGGQSLDFAIMVSCDLVAIHNNLRDKVREAVQAKIPGLDVSKIFLTATHTHTAPVCENDPNFSYQLPKEIDDNIEKYFNFFVGRVSDAIVEAWKKRETGSVSWGLSHAVVAYNRRATYADGSAAMYGDTKRPDFMGVEGLEEHDVNTLFFWNKSDQLMSLIVDVPCPSQLVEFLHVIHADYWHPVREKLKEKYGQKVTVLGWGGASGDHSPRPLYRNVAEERMIRLRNLSPLEEIARRIVAAVDESYETVKNEKQSDIPFVHKTKTLSLPWWKVTKAEYDQTLAERNQAQAKLGADPSLDGELTAYISWNDYVVKCYEEQQKGVNKRFDTEIHVLRIGDIAVCTNEFELFTDYSVRIQARSKALQTFVISFAGNAGYLPTARAIAGGGYSAVAQSCYVGPEGGQELVNQTLDIINSMFAEK
jgi:hypothetical protein